MDAQMRADETGAPPRAELGRLLAALGAAGDVPADECRELHDRLAAGALNLVAVGQFKRGKSSLVNALIGEELLPVGVVPLTSVVTLLAFGERLAVDVVYEDGRRESAQPGKLAEYVTERGNPRNEKRVRQIEIALPSRWLKSGTRLVDTPGIGSVYRHNTDAALRFLPRADAVLFVLSVEQPASEAEQQYLKEVAAHAGRVIVVANKADLLSGAELAESVDFVRRTVAGALGGAVAVFPVSARLALQAQAAGSSERLRASGFTALTAALDAFLDRERDAALAAAVAGNAARLVAQARLERQLELSALAAPLQDLERKLARFAARKRELLETKQEHVFLLEGEQKKLLRETVEPDLHAFEAALVSDIAAHVEAAFEAHRELPLRRLQETLHESAIAEIRRRYDRWRSEEDAKVSAALGEVCRRVAGRLEAAVDELQRFAADLFSVPYDSTRAEPLLSAEAGFRYKFWEAPASLQLLANSAALALPKLLGDRIVLRRAREAAVDAARTQAGRVRYDFQRRLEATAREFAAAMAARIERVLQGLEAALRAGAELRRAGGAGAESRRAAIADALGRLEDAGARLTALRRRAGGPAPTDAVPEKQPESARPPA